MLLFRHIQREAKRPPSPKHKVRLRNLILAIKDQGPLRRFVRNLWKGHVLGLFHIRSHQRDNGKAKVTYNTKASAARAATSMSRKHGVWFSNYKCIFCDGYHLGKNRENK